MFTFRNARSADLPAIVAIYNATIPGRLVTADLEPVSVESRQEWFAGHHPEKRPLWVVDTDGKIAGWLSFKSFYGRPAYNGTVEISIYLAEDFQGKGLGQMMLQKAIDNSPGLGIKTLLGFIFGHNTPSLELFKKFGFEQWALLPKVANLDGIEQDLVILGLRVAE